MAGSATSNASPKSGEAFSSVARAGLNRRPATSTSSIRPSRSSVGRRRLPRTESPTSSAPASTAVPTATPSPTATFIRQ
ncbi:MAG: hypothetical protein B7Z73_07660 [Planctomycetia bacterium 21-64-5]|nr:MAG: hypothetical protein B7Z73_07660 [Planctomycetia bacterium 21-64-5]